MLNDVVKLDRLTARQLPNDVLEFTHTQGGNMIERAIVQLRGQHIDYVDYTTSIHAPEASHVVDRTPHKVLTIGKGNTERTVEHYLTKDNAYQMRLGLTIHNGDGTWSSLPHHFELTPELGFEELFYYILSGKTQDGKQRAIQTKRGMYHNGVVDETLEIIHHETFGVIPMGYHAVCAEPGIKVAYVWAYLCKYPRWEKI